MNQSRTSLIVVIALLLLPVLYVGSYCALVVPKGWLNREVNVTNGGLYTHYRWGGKASELIFWPVEELDRRVRPAAWEPFSQIQRGISLSP